MTQIIDGFETASQQELEVQFGKILHDQKHFQGNSGGAADPDSRRGFGSTSQAWKALTSNGWTIHYEDNPFIIYRLDEPDGTAWYREHKDSFVKNDPDAHYHYIQRGHGRNRAQVKAMVLEMRQKDGFHLIYHALDD